MDGKNNAQGQRWADEIQDGTMQSLAALRLQLAVGLREDSDALTRAAASALEQIDDEIAGLRELLSKMRAAA